MENLTPLSHSIIGLSPAYHEYNPILIHTLQHSLTLLNGVDCLVSLGRSVGADSSGSTRSHSSAAFACGNDNNHVETPPPPPSPSPKNVKILPISKCELVGVVQYCHYKSNGTLNIILDDGTSLCDCIGWVDDDDDDGDGVGVGDNWNDVTNIKVGDLVRVRGAIRILSLHPKGKRIVPVSSLDSTCTYSHTHTHTHTRYYEGWKCIREVRVHNIHVFEGNDKWDEEAAHWLRCLQFRQRMELELNDDVDGAICHGSGSGGGKSVNATPILNGLQVLHALPDKYKKDVLSMGLGMGGVQLHQGVDDNTVGRDMGTGGGGGGGGGRNDALSRQTMSREGQMKMQGDERLLIKYFGRQCTCDDEKSYEQSNNSKQNAKVKADVKSYMNRLLYCHCIATREALDPDWTFRDALLTKLLSLEDDNDTDAAGLTSESLGGQCSGKNDDSRDNNHRVRSAFQHFNFHLDTSIPYNSLLFGFQSLYQDNDLHSIAAETVSKTRHPTINIRRLYTQTFRHLRTDGIVYLLDEGSDTYMLLSRYRVLLPAMRNVICEEEQMERELRQSRQNQLGSNILQGAHSWAIQPPVVPKFLQSVPISKMRLIRRLAASQRIREQNANRDRTATGG